MSVWDRIFSISIWNKTQTNERTHSCPAAVTNGHGHWFTFSMRFHPNFADSKNLNAEYLICTPFFISHSTFIQMLVTASRHPFSLIFHMKLVSFSWATQLNEHFSEWMLQIRLIIVVIVHFILLKSNHNFSNKPAYKTIHENIMAVRYNTKE